MELKKVNFKIQQDPRGSSVDIFKSSIVPLNVKSVYLINSNPKTIRGNHYHKKKNEWLCVFKGKAKLYLMDNKTKQKKTLTLSQDKISVVYIKPNVVHAIKNIGKKELCIFEMSDREFDPKNPDTFRVQIV